MCVSGVQVFILLKKWRMVILIYKKKKKKKSDLTRLEQPSLVVTVLFQHDDLYSNVIKHHL